MIRFCEPPKMRPIGRLSAEEFCNLVQSEASSAYRPRSEVLRMLTVGEIWGNAGAALMIQPMCADTAQAAALREYIGRRTQAGGCFMTPPVVHQPEQLAVLLTAAKTRAEHLAGRETVWAILECTTQAERWLPVYLQQGFVLCALRPLESLAPCFLLCKRSVPADRELLWVPLEDRAQLVSWLARGYRAVDSRPGPQGLVLAMLLQ